MEERKGDRKRGKAERQPQAGHAGHTRRARLEEEALETGRVKREGVSQRAFPSESACRPQLEATATHILLPSTQPLMRDVGRGRGRQQKAAVKRSFSGSHGVQ